MLTNHLTVVIKYIKRSSIDIDYCLNFISMKDLEGDLSQSKETMNNTLKNITDFQEYYDSNLKELLAEIIREEELNNEEMMKANMLTPDKRKNKFALSQPILFQKNVQVE